METTGSFTDYTARFIDPAVGFALGWNYWFLWAGILMAEYSRHKLLNKCHLRLLIAGSFR